MEPRQPAKVLLTYFIASHVIVILGFLCPILLKAESSIKITAAICFCTVSITIVISSIGREIIKAILETKK
jgi:uncharacterized membrane protein